MRTPGSTNRHDLSALMAPPPPPDSLGLCVTAAHARLPGGTGLALVAESVVPCTASRGAQLPLSASLWRVDTRRLPLRVHNDCPH